MRPGVASDGISPAPLHDDPDRQITIMKAGNICRILEKGQKSRSNLKLLLNLDHNCCLHKNRHPEMLPYGKPSGKGISLAELLNSGRYELTSKDKIMLSFAVARSFWEFYGSEMTTSRWCSDDIWFMPRQNFNRKNSDKLELKAFVGFPFERIFPGPDECLDMDELAHSYPRILSLGIILLEIGRSENLGLLPLTVYENLDDTRNSVNDAHWDASRRLAELKDEVWDTCKYKNAFDTAISSCLSPSKFMESLQTRKRRSRMSSEDYRELSPERKVIEDANRAKYNEMAIRDRREAIYHNVVSPLYWLAKVGNDNGKDDIFIEPRKHVGDRPPISLDDPNRAEVERLWKRVQTPSFNSNSRAKEGGEKWFEDLRAISNLVFLRRRKMGFKLPPVRIAILDTGCDLTLGSFETAKCFKGWRDFATNPSSEIEEDKYGHGTFMARLVMQIVPGCELYIARVAKTKDQLESNEDIVAEVSDPQRARIPSALLSKVYRL